MLSIWNYIEENTLKTWKTHTARIGCYDEGIKLIRDNFPQLETNGSEALENLNERIKYLGFNNKKAADSLVVRSKLKLLELLSQQNINYGPNVTSKQLVLFEQFETAQRALLNYAKQWNRALTVACEEESYGQRLWSGAKVHIEEGELNFRDTGSRTFITLPAPFASHVSRLYMGMWEAVSDFADHMTKYEYIGRPAEQVGALIEKEEDLLDKVLYETLLGEAFTVIDEWKLNTIKAIKMNRHQFVKSDVFDID
jgi:hypothetical protein